MSTTTPPQTPPRFVDASTQTSRKRSRSRSESPAPPERPSKRPAPNTEPRKKQPIKFLIISDTHDTDTDDEDSFKPPTNTTVDVVLHCGDLTENGSLPSLANAVKKLASIPAELRLMIAGNHDITLDAPYHLREGGSPAVSAAALKLVAATAGVTYLAEGTHGFALRNGAATLTVHASPWTPRHGACAFQYPSGHGRFNPASTTPAWATNVATAASSTSS